MLLTIIILLCIIAGETEKNCNQHNTKTIHLACCVYINTKDAFLG